MQKRQQKRPSEAGKQREVVSLDMTVSAHKDETPLSPLATEIGGHTPFWPQWCRLGFYLRHRRVKMLRAFVGSVASEFYSLGRRIEILRRTKLYWTGVQLGPSALVLPTQRVVSCEATFSRIRDTRCMRANYPWATALDVLLFLEGWEMGAIWAACSVRNHEPRTEDMASAASDITQQIEAVQKSRNLIASRISGVSFSASRAVDVSSRDSSR
jgi:hypothetical protein